MCLGSSSCKSTPRTSSVRVCAVERGGGGGEDKESEARNINRWKCGQHDKKKNNIKKEAKERMNLRQIQNKLQVIDLGGKGLDFVKYCDHDNMMTN